jgi:hypothetical protein
MKYDPRAPPFPAKGVYHNETAEMTAFLVSWQAENIQIFTPFGDECHLDEVVQRHCCGNAGL